MLLMMMVMMVSTAAGAVLLFVAFGLLAIFFRGFCLQGDMVNTENSQNLPHIVLCSERLCRNDVHRGFNGMLIDAPDVDMVYILYVV